MGSNSRISGCQSKRLNTTHTAYGNSPSVNSLTGAHEILFDGPPPTLFEDDTHPWYREQPYDPSTNSGSVVTCYDAGEHRPILEHNLPISTVRGNSERERRTQFLGWW